MNAYFEDHVGDAGLGLEVLPGVVDLLKALQVRGDLHDAVPRGLRLPCRVWSNQNAACVTSTWCEACRSAVPLSVDA